jgi:hypothetical protein
MPDENRAPELPAPNVSLIAIGHLMRVLEHREPGIIDEWLKSLEDEHVEQEIIRLRAPRVAKELREANDQALVWAGLVRAVAKTTLPLKTEPRPPRTWWEKFFGA